MALTLPATTSLNSNSKKASPVKPDSSMLPQPQSSSHMCDDSNMGRLSEEQLKRKPEDVFDIVQKLGEGSYGSVYKAIHKESQHVLAIKQVPLDTDLQEIIKEISIMQQCDSPYIVRYYGSYFRNDELLIVMEYCDGGSVSDIMRMRRRTLIEEHIATILQDALHGLDYLHARRRIHRDIKAGNILLSVSESHAKLADFGVAGQLTDTMAKRNTVIGTPFWMAPEVIQEVGYDCSADIWSLGITAIEMAEGKPPYAEIHPMRAIFMIPTKPPPSFRQPDNWSQEFIDFVSQCLMKNAEQRATATQLLQHEFIEKMRRPFSSLHAVIAEAAEVREQKRLEQIAAYNAEQQEILPPGQMTASGTIKSRASNGGGSGSTKVATSGERHHHQRHHDRRRKRRSRKVPTAPEASPVPSSGAAVADDTNNAGEKNAGDYADKTVKFAALSSSPAAAESQRQQFETLNLNDDAGNNDDDDALLSPASAAATATQKTFATTRSTNTVIIHSSDEDGDDDRSDASSESTEGPDDDNAADFSTAKSMDNDENGTVFRRNTTQVRQLYGTAHPYRPAFMEPFQNNHRNLMMTAPSAPPQPSSSLVPSSNSSVLNGDSPASTLSSSTATTTTAFDIAQFGTMQLGELEQRIRDLDTSMERELEALRIKYLEKRKPIAEAIEEKKRSQLHF